MVKLNFINLNHEWIMQNHTDLTNRTPYILPNFYSTALVLLVDSIMIISV
jgi:hypothetical protein